MVQISLNGGKKKKASASQKKMEPLEMEPMVAGANEGGEYGETMPAKAATEPRPLDPVAFVHNLFALIFVYASYYKNIVGPIAGLLIMIVVILLLEKLAKISTGKNHVKIDTDFALVHAHELEMSNVHYWCMNGDNDSCSCDDPTMPRIGKRKGWLADYKKHLRKIKEVVSERDIDVVFLGDDTIASWGGASSGSSSVAQYFTSKYDVSKDVTNVGEGLAMGIAGDTISNVYFRYFRGGAYHQLEPKIWWLSVGMNDFRNGQCSDEVVLLGILNLMELIHHNHPETYVVINSLLPQGSTVRVHRGAEIKLWPSIVETNKKLKAFCEHHEWFHFYDATSHFVMKDSTDEVLHMNKESYQGKSDTPSLKGHQKWITGTTMLVAELIDDEQSDDAVRKEMNDDEFNNN